MKQIIKKVQVSRFQISKSYSLIMERSAHKEPEKQPNNPLHGKTLEAILVYLVSYYGWEELGDLIRINSFRNNPSLKSSLKFLRKTPWAREKVENLYVKTVKD